jgi:RNA polymerase sigma-70 factor (sigma-E family)
VDVEGAHEAFRRFVVDESAGLLQTAWMLTGERALAEDLVQTALARTWPHWTRISAGGTPAAYVRRVMVRTFASWMGRRWNGEIPSERVPESAVDDPAFSSMDDRDSLYRVLANLPRRQRAAVVLRHYLDLSEQEAAEALGCSIGSVKSHASRGLARMREMAADPEWTDVNRDD